MSSGVLLVRCFYNFTYSVIIFGRCPVSIGMGTTNSLAKGWVPSQVGTFPQKKKTTDKLNGLQATRVPQESAMTRDRRSFYVTRYRRRPLGASWSLHGPPKTLGRSNRRAEVRAVRLGAPGSNPRVVAPRLCNTTSTKLLQVQHQDDKFITGTKTRRFGLGLASAHYYS